MTPKAKLESFFASNADSNAKISKYEENKKLFVAMLSSGNANEIEFALQTKIMHYASSLNDIKQFKKALIVLGEIEIDLDKVRSKPTVYKSYSTLVALLKGTALHRIRRYTASNVEFKKLLLTEPKNAHYLKWYRSNKKNQIGFISTILISISLTFHIMVHLGALSYPFFDNPIMQHIGLTIAVSSLIISFIWMKIIEKSEVKLT